MNGWIADMHSLIKVDRRVNLRRIVATSAGQSNPLPLKMDKSWFDYLQLILRTPASERYVLAIAQGSPYCPTFSTR